MSRCSTGSVCRRASTGSGSPSFPLVSARVRASLLLFLTLSPQNEPLGRRRRAQFLREDSGTTRSFSRPEAQLRIFLVGRIESRTFQPGGLDVQ